MSLSFLTPGGATIASVVDTAFTRDADGYATLIVGTGASIPSWITPANGYTFLDLTAITGYQRLSLLDLRHILPGAGFNCAGPFVPYRMTVDTPAGSLMGDYEPVVAPNGFAAGTPERLWNLSGRRGRRAPELRRL